MLDTHSLLVGLTGLVLLASPAASTVTGASAPAARQQVSSNLTPATQVSSAKGDRLDGGAVRAAPFGASAVLFRSDPMTGTTFVAKAAAPVPAPSRRSEEPQGAGPVKRTVGCEAAVSPLVKQQAANVPGRCVT